jgi:hypothetical protein
LLAGFRNHLTYAAAVFVVVGLFGSVAAGAAMSARATEYGYVTTQLTLPGTQTQVNAYARDIDRDGQRDNGLGQFFATLDQHGLDFQTDLDAAVERGDLLMLHSLRTPSFKKATDATWQVLFAEPSANPDFSGFGSFTVPSTEPRSPRLATRIVKRNVKTAAGTVPLRLDLLGRIFDLTLEKGKIGATCSPSGCSDGRINGIITAEEVATYLIPELSAHFTPIVQRDCTMPGQPSGGCMADSTGKTIFNLFDHNDDLVITELEIQDNSLAPLVPDLDLVKANGKPGRDGVEDALSVGVGFETVRAQLVRP